MSQPRPVVNASRSLGALSLLAGVFPIVGSAFGWIEWDPDQLKAYTVGIGVVISAIALFLGVNVEKQVTPTLSPKDDDGVPFVPIALDSFED